MWVKICGNTTLGDALQAAESGADALGFIFALSPRQLSPHGVAAITGRLPAGIERVGVFDSHEPDEILLTAAHAGLTTIQLHGGFDPALLDRLLPSRGHNLRIIQALHWTMGAAEEKELQTSRLSRELRTLAELSSLHTQPVRVLVDSKVGSASGGTGLTFDWHAAAEVFAVATELGLPIVAAGGLNPENVGEAIARLHPWGVDVASGVEASRGRKDPARVAEFIANARDSKALDQSSCGN